MHVASRWMLSVLIALIGGCATAQTVAASRQEIDRRRAGQVYVLRGFMGVWSRGMDQITLRLRKDGLPTTIVGDDEWQGVAAEIIASRKNHSGAEPLVLIGHSYGADNVLRIAQRLGQEKIGVDLVITVECVVPPLVPSNVSYIVNIYKPRALDLLPWWRGVPVSSQPHGTSVIEQIDVHRDRPDIDRPDLGHSDIDKDPKVLDLIERKVLQTCPAISHQGAA